MLNGKKRLTDMPPPPPNSTPRIQNVKYADVIWQNRHQGHLITIFLHTLIHLRCRVPFIQLPHRRPTMQPPASSTSSSQSPDQSSQPSQPEPETPATGSSSSSRSNPLYPSILPTSATLLATKLGPTLPYYQSQTQVFAAAADPEQVRREEMEARQRAMPEKCFSWCTQSEMARPFCRMVCLRKRGKGVGVGMTREEQLERLRPRQKQRIQVESASASADALASVISPSPSPSSSSSSIVEWLSSPIATLRSRLTPYSIIYIRGTPDGVIGRYMEELEWDDGVYDFKGLSRGQVAKSAGRGSGRGRDEDPKMEWLEWGDQG